MARVQQLYVPASLFSPPRSSSLKLGFDKYRAQLGPWSADGASGPTHEGGVRAQSSQPSET
jgi:hypothetical protein